jgi:hypothetical protein
MAGAHFQLVSAREEHKPMRVAHTNGARSGLEKRDGAAPSNRHQSNEIEIL